MFPEPFQSLFFGSQARAQSNARQASPMAQYEAQLRQLNLLGDPRLAAQYQSLQGRYTGNNVAYRPDPRAAHNSYAGFLQGLGGGLLAGAAQHMTMPAPESASERRARRIEAVKRGREKQLITRAEAELREYLGETLWTFPERVKKIVAMMDEVFAE